MYKFTILVIFIHFALCNTIQSTWEVPASYVQEIPFLPSSFKSSDQHAVTKAIEDALACTETNPYWNSQELEGKLHSGIPMCLVTKRKHMNFTKLHEEQVTSATNCSRIPKIIHQQWKEKKIPLEWTEYHRSWQKHNPDWHILIWSDADEAEFLEAHFPWFMKTFTAFPYAVERADAFRYWLMWVYGGIYVDIDYECKRPLSDYIYELRKPVSMVTPQNGGFSNSLLISTPQHPFWRYLVEELYESGEVSSLSRHTHVINTSGPKFLTNAVPASNLSSDICALTRELFHPCSYCDSDNECKKSCKGCYASHHYAKTWNDWSSSMSNLFTCNPDLKPAFCGGAVVLVFLGFCLKKRKYRKKKEPELKLVVAHNM